MTAQALHTEIKGKKEKVEDVQKDADTCATSIKVGSQIVRTFILKHFTSWWAQASMVQNNDVTYCYVCFQDYELQLASYSSGLETLLKIPIKRTMLQSPASVVRQEVWVLSLH